MVDARLREVVLRLSIALAMPLISLNMHQGLDMVCVLWGYLQLHGWRRCTCCHGDGEVLWRVVADAEYCSSPTARFGDKMGAVMSAQLSNGVGIGQDRSQGHSDSMRHLAPQLGICQLQHICNT